MSAPKAKLPHCPRCGSTNVTVCGRSIEYRPEDHPDQPLLEREHRTVAYQCQCGLAFTVMSKGGPEAGQ